MNYLIKLAGLAICLVFMSFTSPSGLEYHNGTLESAKLKAASENKLVFVKFYADWCVPCKWMEETTFSDPSIMNTINSNFVAVKVNIDDFDGFALRQKLKVGVLPTMIIYNSKGKMVKRIEETLPTSKMKTALRDAVSKNGGNIIHNVNASPSKQIKKPTSNNTDYKRKSYKLQLGVFKSFENTMNYLEEMKDKIDEQAMVLNDYKNGQTMYKVLIGRYKTLEDANRAKDILKAEQGIDSVIF